MAIFAPFSFRYFSVMIAVLEKGKLMMFESVCTCFQTGFELFKKTCTICFCPAFYYMYGYEMSLRLPELNITGNGI